MSEKRKQKVILGLTTAIVFAFAVTAVRADSGINDEKAMYVIYSFFTFGILLPTVIAIFMLSRIMMSRCPLCGEGMTQTHKGKRVISEVCPKCDHHQTKPRGFPTLSSFYPRGR